MQNTQEHHNFDTMWRSTSPLNHDVNVGTEQQQQQQLPNDNLELFSSFITNNSFMQHQLHQQQGPFLYNDQGQNEQDLLPLIAPLTIASPPTMNDDSYLTNQVFNNSTTIDNSENMTQRQHHRQSLTSQLSSLEIQPFISVTEPTPIRRNYNPNHIIPSSAASSIIQQQPVTLDFVDSFISQHSSQLQQEETLAAATTVGHNDVDGFLTEFLVTQNHEWLSWTPGRQSPASSFDNSSVGSQDGFLFSNETFQDPVLFGNNSLAMDEWSSNGNNTSIYNANFELENSSHVDRMNDTEHLLSVKKGNRGRTLSEPPKPSGSFLFDLIQQQQDQQQQQQQQQTNNHYNHNEFRQMLSNTNINSNPNNNVTQLQQGQSLHPYNNRGTIHRSHSDRRPSGGRRARSSSSVNGSPSMNGENTATVATPPAATVGSHPCPYLGCSKVFARTYNLTSHMRTHTPERPFACSNCGRKFARQHDRNRHEKLHWGIKPYACRVCSKPFARLDALNRHLKVENGCGSSINQAQQQQQQNLA